MNYHHLTEIERYQIQAGIALGMNINDIAISIKRNRSTVTREIKRNGHITREGYSALYSVEQYRKRREKCRPAFKVAGEIKHYIEERIRQKWSPEQIAGRADFEGISLVAIETIYRYLFRDRQAGGDLWTHLRHSRQRRNKRFAYYRWPKTIPRPSIESRPDAISNRERIGDFERDLIVGHQHKSYLLTIVDRKTKLTKLSKVPRSTGKIVHSQTIKSLNGLEVKSITNDNGCEFVDYLHTQNSLNVPIYFTRPYASWERGTVENTNKLIRQYFPKGTDLSEVTHAKIQMVEMALNDRPRKTLGFRTPNEETFQPIG
ncbi:MAG: IS30 family transposase [Deltaproteobacteria bacterium]|nr:IS30 family transposase [Deltaproteobacteria bacterium]